MIPRVVTLYDFKCLVSNKKKEEEMQRKYDSYTGKENAVNRNHSEEAQILVFLYKDFTSHTTNMFKELKDVMSKDGKERVRKCLTK